MGISDRGYFINARAKGPDSGEAAPCQHSQMRVDKDLIRYHDGAVKIAAFVDCLCIVQRKDDLQSFNFSEGEIMYNPKDRSVDPIPYTSSYIFPKNTYPVKRKHIRALALETSPTDFTPKRQHIPR